LKYNARKAGPLCKGPKKLTTDEYMVTSKLSDALIGCLQSLSVASFINARDRIKSRYKLKISAMTSGDVFFRRSNNFGFLIR
jgi:hypothetical protein